MWKRKIQNKIGSNASQVLKSACGSTVFGEVEEEERTETQVLILGFFY